MEFVKVCKKCKLEKPIDMFFVNRATKDGRQIYCKPCHQEKVKTSRLLNIDRHRSVAREWRLRNRGYHIKKCREWYKNNKSHALDYAKKYREENIDDITERNKEWRINNPNYKKLWRQRNKDIDKGYKSSRRAKERNGIAEKLSKSVYDLIMAKQSNKCVYCMQQFCKDLKPTLDHITPISKGGSHTADNLVYACMSCNARKCANLPSVILEPILPFIN